MTADWNWQDIESQDKPQSVRIAGVDVAAGTRVRLKPGRGGDAIDIALAGRCARVESVEQDYEGRIYLAVVVEDDPGREFGLMRQPGHRFFFSVHEVEPIHEAGQEDAP